MKSSGKNISLTSYDDIFTTEANSGAFPLGTIVEIPLDQLHPFKNHPFRVVDDEHMQKTAESIRDYGVLVPGLVRPRLEGGYEIISGHRRRRASEIAQKKTMPVIIRDLDDDEATIAMKSKKKRQLREKAWQRKVVRECQRTTRELKRSIDRYFYGTLLPTEERLFRDIRQMFQEKAANMSIEDKLVMALKIHLAVPNDCLLYMHNHRGRLNPNRPNNGIDPKTGIYPNDHYECSSYSLSSMREERQCAVHHISTRALYGLVLETIRLTAQYAVSNQAEFIQKVREASEIKQNTAAKELKKQITKAKKRSTELDGLIKKLYESYATGKLTESRFDMLIADYEREQAEINEMIASENERLAAYEEDTGKINDFLALTKKYTDFTQLTPQMIYEFIDRIEVHKPEKVDGERTQEVEIFLKYIGKFDVPLPDPTPEEIAEAEKLKRRRASGRERARRQREKKKAAEQAAQQKEKAKEIIV